MLLRPDNNQFKIVEKIKTFLHASLDHCLSILIKMASEQQEFPVRKQVQTKADCFDDKISFDLFFKKYTNPSTFMYNKIKIPDNSNKVTKPFKLIS